MVSRDQPRGRVFLGVESTGDDVEREAKWCQQVLGKGRDATAQQIWIGIMSKRLRNGKINKRRSQKGKEQRKRPISVATVWAMAELSKSIRRARGRMWQDFPKNLRGA
jgi:hypothetical protein